jgi:hypothetical protein
MQLFGGPCTGSPLGRQALVAVGTSPRRQSRHAVSWALADEFSGLPEPLTAQSFSRWRRDYFRTLDAPALRGVLEAAWHHENLEGVDARAAGLVGRRIGPPRRARPRLGMARAGPRRILNPLADTTDEFPRSIESEARRREAISPSRRSALRLVGSHRDTGYTGLGAGRRESKRGLASLRTWSGLPMILSAQGAIIPSHKLRDYLLSPTHSDGRTKSDLPGQARVFSRHLSATGGRPARADPEPRGRAGAAVGLRTEV